VRCQSGKDEREAANTKYKQLKKAEEDANKAYAAAQAAVTREAPGPKKEKLKKIRAIKEGENEAASEALSKFTQEAPEGWAPPV